MLPQALSRQAQAGFLASLLGALVLAPSARTQIRAEFDPLGREQLLVSSNEVIGGGAVRVFDLKHGSLLRQLQRPQWTRTKQGRPLALDGQGRLWVKDGSETLYQFDRRYRFLRSFTLDLSLLGSPVGDGFTDMTFAQDGTLWLVGNWDGDNLSYLLQVDPETEDILTFQDLQSRFSPPFGAARMAWASDTVLYLTEGPTSAGPPMGRIGLSTGAVLAGPAGPREFQDIQRLPGGALLLGARDSGELWLSSPNLSIWNVVQSCGSPLAYSQFALSHGRAHVVSGDCGSVRGELDVVHLKSGTVERTIDLTAGGRFDPQISHVLVRP